MATGYKISATIIKSGGEPVVWTRFSRREMTKSQCEEMFSTPGEFGASLKKRSVVCIENFRCEAVDYFSHQ